LPVQGTAESILVGFREDLIEIVSCSAETYCISVQVINKKKIAFAWQLVVVYGTAYAEFKLEFFAQLDDIMDLCSLPVILTISRPFC
jgi:hypothetical protein